MGSTFIDVEAKILGWEDCIPTICHLDWEDNCWYPDEKFLLTAAEWPVLLNYQAQMSMACCFCGTPQGSALD